MSLSEFVLKKLPTNINKEIPDLRQNYEKMQLELCVSRQVSSKLREQIVSLEQQCWSNCQVLQTGMFRTKCFKHQNSFFN